MKQIKRQRHDLPVRLTVLFSVALCAFFMLGRGVQAAAAEKEIWSTADFTVKAVEESADSCKIVVTPKVSIDWIEVHFGGENVKMEKIGNDFVYQVNMASYGDIVDVFFTYSSNVAHDTDHFNYMVGSTYDEAGSSNGDNNGSNTGDSNDGNNGSNTGDGNDGNNSGNTGGGNGGNNGNNTGEDNGNNNDDNKPTSNPWVEAEAFTDMSGINKGDEQITGLDVNDWMRYQLDIPDAGAYRIVVRGKSEDKDGVLVFRDAKKRIGTVKLTGNGEDAEYKSDGTVELSKGNLQLTVIVVSGKISADWIAFEPVDPDDNNNQGGNGSTGGDDNQGGNGNTGGDGNQGGNNNTDYVEPPVVDTTIPEQENKMIFQFNNKTNGAYSDDKIYWCALGYRPNADGSAGELCYVDSQGVLHTASTDLNDTNLPNNRRSARKIVNTLAQNKYVYMPSIISGRMYVSYGEPIDIEFNIAADGKVGFAGPNLDDINDPNAEKYFEFMEFTIGLFGAAVEEPTHYWGNTTRVDNFCFPVVTRLIGENRKYEGTTVIGAEPYDKTVGDLGGRDYLRDEFVKNAPDEFKNGLVDDYRIFAPCKKTFNEGQTNGYFFDDTINKFWEKYSNEDFYLECQGGHFRARVEGGILKFTDERTGDTGRIDKPTTQDVLEGKGAFDRRTQPGRPGDLELVLEAQLCAAFNRGLALKPTGEWYTVANYYKSENYPYNYYAGFWHQHGIGGLGYGFCYDDVNDQSTLLECNTAKQLVIDLKWN